MPGLPIGLSLPESELVERFSRASGPGGQSVNTTDSRVQLSWDLGASAVVSDVQRQLLLRRLRTRLVGTCLTITAAEHRSQHRNRAAARERLVALLAEAFAPPPPPRRKVKPSRAAVQRRLAGKRHRAEVKQARRRPLAE